MRLEEIQVPKLGRVNMAESLRFSGKLLSARISKQAVWWFASITVEMPEAIPLNTHPPVGVDVGLNRLATLSDGRRYENQRQQEAQFKRFCNLASILTDLLLALQNRRGEAFNSASYLPVD